MPLKSDEIEKLTKQLNQLKKDLPTNFAGQYRGYVTCDLGNRLKQLLNQIQPEHFPKLLCDKAAQVITELEKLNTPDRIRGYLKADLGMLVNQVFSQLSDEIDKARPTKVDASPHFPNTSSVFESLSPRQGVGQLCWAISNGQDPAEINSLIKKVADINATDFSGITPLTQTVLSRDELTLKKLVTIKGFDINARNEDQTTALHQAVFKDDESMVKVLLDYGADSTIFSVGRQAVPSVLVYAADHASAELAKLLYDRCSTGSIATQNKQDLERLQARFSLDATPSKMA